MLKIAYAVRQLIKELECTSRQLTSRRVLADICGTQARWQWLAEWSSDQDIFISNAICPLNVPEARKLQVVELLTRVNYNMVMGNFVLDFRDGEVSFRSCLPLKKGRIDPEELQKLVCHNFRMLENHLPLILAVAFGDKSPAEAIAEAKAQEKKEPKVIQDRDPGENAPIRGGRLANLGEDLSNN